MVGQRRQWRQLERRVRGVRSSSVVVDQMVMVLVWRGRTQLGAFRECVIIVHIIVIWFILFTILTFVFTCVL